MLDQRVMTFLRNPRRIVAAALLSIALLPPLQTLTVILRLGVNVPLQDDWDLVTVIAKWHEGTVELAALGTPAKAAEAMRRPAAVRRAALRTKPVIVAPP